MSASVISPPPGDLEKQVVFRLSENVNLQVTFQNLNNIEEESAKSVDEKDSTASKLIPQTFIEK